jgi:hypothetical protein
MPLSHAITICSCLSIRTTSCAAVEAVWHERRVFLIEGVHIPTARLLHIIQSKHAVGRDKDRLFLATHKDALEQLLKRRED